VNSHPAVSKDSEAPIFEIADYAVVGSLFDIIPPLIEEVEEGRKLNFVATDSRG